jgi:protein-tyrosine-phosphatase
VIVSLCKGGARALPQRPAKKTVGLDWILPDPSKAHGTAAEVRAVYEQAYETLTTHIRDLVRAILGKDARQTHEDTTSSL